MNYFMEAFIKISIHCMSQVWMDEVVGVKKNYQTFKKIPFLFINILNQCL